MGLSHNWDTPEEHKAYILDIERKTGEEEAELVKFYYKAITNEVQYANRSPVEWAETFLRGIAKEPWTSHQRETVFVKHGRRIRELKAGHAIIGPLFTSNKRGNLKKISSLELGPNNFKAAVWAIRQIQDERQKNGGRDRLDYCDAVQAQDQAVQEFVKRQEKVIEQWKRADKETEEEEGEQSEDQLNESFVLMCKNEAEWIRAQIGENFAARETREKELVEEWMEKREEEWKKMLEEEVEEERDESEIGEEDWEDMEDKKMEEAEEIRKEEEEIDRIIEEAGKKKNQESQDHTQKMTLKYSTGSDTSSQTSQASTSIGYDTRIYTPPPRGNTPESSQESEYGTAPDPMDFTAAFEHDVMMELEDYIEGDTEEWQTAAWAIADSVVSELTQKKAVDLYFRDAISKSIRGVRRKFANQQEQPKDTETAGRKIRTLPQRESNKKRIVDKLVQGLMSSKYSSQQEMDRQTMERKKQKEETEEKERKEVENEKRKARAGKAKEEEEKKKRGEKERGDQEQRGPDGELTEKNLREWMSALAAKVMRQDKKIEELEEVVVKLRMEIKGKGKGRENTGRPAQENFETRGATPQSPLNFPRPPPNRGPGGPALQQETKKSYAAAAAPPAGPRNEVNRPARPNNNTGAVRETEGERQKVRLAEKRDEEAKFKLEIALPVGMEAQAFIKNETLETVAEVLAVPASQIRSIRQIGSKNIIEVTCRTVEAREAVLRKGKEVALEKGEAKISATENWTGMVVGGIWEGAEREESQGGWKVFREGFEKENGVRLTKDPRWLTKKEHHTKGYQQSIVIHVAKTSDRNTLLRSTKVEGQAKRVRLFESARDKARKQCTKCCEYGHLWFECSKEARCGKFGKNGHTSWTHKCADKKCTGNRNRVACNHDVKKCCNCGGDHGAMEQHCPARAKAFTEAIEKITPPSNKTSGCAS